MMDATMIGNHVKLNSSELNGHKRMKSMTQPIQTHVVSQIPGRLRLRVASKHRHPENIEKIADTLAAHPHVEDVRTNYHTGSIVIHHTDHHEIAKDIIATAQDVMTIAGTIIERSEAAVGVSNAVQDLNQRVAHLTNGTVDLRFLLPLGFGTLAVRQLIVKGLQFDIIPWYVLAWYCFDSFIKLHYTSDPLKKVTSDE